MYANILPSFQVRRHVQSWLEEDIPNFDIAAVALSSDEVMEGVINIKEQCVLAGFPFVEEVFNQLKCTIEWKVDEGTKITTIPSQIAIVRGPLKQILQGERLALNILSRACGIATTANRLAGIVTTNKWKGHVVGTRKTTPGFRLVEKYAMVVGGSAAHRFDLSSMVMLKDNHIDSMKPLKDLDREKTISMAVSQTRKIAGHSMKIEVESRNEKEAIAAALAGADIVMLDNFTSKVACSCAQRLKSRFPRVTIEVSGNITETNIASYMCSSVDMISTSKLSNGYSVIDLSMKLQESTAPCIPKSATKVVAVGVKRTVTEASGGDTADNANDNRNGDSGVLVDIDADVADVPGKRRKTDEKTPERDVQSEDKAVNQPKTPMAAAAARSVPTVKSSPASTAKPPSSSVGKITPQTVAQKTPQQSPTPSSQSIGKQGSTSATEKPIDSDNEKAAKANSPRSSPVSASTPASRSQPTQSNQPSSKPVNKYNNNQSSASRDPPSKATSSHSPGSKFNPPSRTSSFQSSNRPYGNQNSNSRSNPTERTYGNQNTGFKDNVTSRGYGNQNSMSRGNINQHHSGQFRGQQASSQSNQPNRFRGQDDKNDRFPQNTRGFQGSSSTSVLQRPQPPQPAGRGIVGTFNSNPVHQQLTLQVAASRATGVSLRPGSGLIGTVQNNRGFGGFGGSNIGSRGPLIGGRPQHNRDWENRYRN